MKTAFLLAQLFTYNGPKALGEGGAGSLKSILSLVFAALGAISVIVLIFAGIRLTMSRGNPDAIGKLRSTIIYAGVGLFIALSASAILNFVISRV